MNKSIDNELDSELNEWVFPDIAVLKNVEINHNDAHRIEHEIKLKQLKLTEDKLRNDLQLIKQDYENKLAILNSILGKMKDPLEIIDEDFILIIKDLIKAVVKKIILKEIQEDDQLIHSMIDELKSLIYSQGGLVTVYLSKHDFNKVDADVSGVQVKIHSDLNEGDLIIKTNTGEVRAVLDERINKLIGLPK